MTSKADIRKIARASIAPYPETKEVPPTIMKNLDNVQKDLEVLANDIGELVNAVHPILKPVDDTEEMAAGPVYGSSINETIQVIIQKISSIRLVVVETKRRVDL